MLAGRPRVVSWPFALGAEMLSGAESWLRGSLEQFQSGLDAVVWTSLEGHHQAEVTSVDIAAWHDENATDLTTSEDLAGLGLLPGRVLLPHCTAGDAPRAEDWSQRHGFEVLGVPESSGLVVDGDDVVVCGPDPVWLSTPGGTTTLSAGATVPDGGAAS